MMIGPGRPCAKLHPELIKGCTACDLYLSNEEYKKLWDEAPVTPPPTVHKNLLGEIQPLAVPKEKWSLAARIIAKLKVPTDTGLGDTIARHLDRFGGDAFKRLYKKITGSECGCANRQAALNALYPYQE